MILVNALLFQCLWFAAVLGAASGLWWPALPALLVLVAWCWKFSKRFRADMGLMTAAAVIGIVIESVFAASGWIDYAAGLPSDRLAPAWIVFMWCGFGLTVNHSLWPLVSRTWLAAVSGAVFGPIAYYGAARLDAVDRFGLPNPQMELLLAVAWAVSLAFLSALAAYWRRAEKS